jgi:hypothetical protein
MRCLACNCELTDHEAVRKDTEGRFIDLCNSCYYDVRNDILSIDDCDVMYVNQARGDDE